MASSEPLLNLETVIKWARSGCESDKVYRFIFLHPDDFFIIPKGRSYSIAHQVVYNGDVFLLKRILVLFADEQVNIRQLSADKKTLLDVARDRQGKYPNMFEYVERLFHRDDLICAAKQNDWRSVEGILERHPELANERSPYSTYFLLHYLVQYGDTNLFKKLFTRFEFDTNILTTDLETPLDIARRLKRDDICSILASTTRERFETDLIKPRASLTSNTTTTTSALPYPKVDRFPSVDLHNNTLLINSSGNYGVEKKSFFQTTKIELSPPKQDQQLYPKLDHTDSTEGVDSPDSVTGSKPPLETPITASSKTQLLKNLTCPLTGQIMIDPVIASDGQTYEREAITEFIKIYRSSPTTGSKIDTTFKDNVELKQIIESMKKQN